MLFIHFHYLFIWTLVPKLTHILKQMSKYIRARFPSNKCVFLKPNTSIISNSNEKPNSNTSLTKNVPLLTKFIEERLEIIPPDLIQIVMNYVITCNSQFISFDLSKNEWYHDFRVPYRQVVLVSQCRCEDDIDCEHCQHRAEMNGKYSKGKCMDNEELFSAMNAKEMEKFHNSYMEGWSSVFNVDLSNIIFNPKSRLDDRLNVYFILTTNETDQDSVKIQGFLDFENIKQQTEEFEYNCLQIYFHLDSFCL